MTQGKWELFRRWRHFPGISEIRPCTTVFYCLDASWGSFFAFIVLLLPMLNLKPLSDLLMRMRWWRGSMSMFQPHRATAAYRQILDESGCIIYLRTLLAHHTIGDNWCHLCYVIMVMHRQSELWNFLKMQQSLLRVLMPKMKAMIDVVGHLIAQVMDNLSAEQS